MKITTPIEMEERSVSYIIKEAEWVLNNRMPKGSDGYEISFDGYLSSEKRNTIVSLYEKSGWKNVSFENKKSIFCKSCVLILYK